MIFDAGVFIALEKPSSRGVVLALVERHLDEGVLPATTNAVLAQVWREPARQVALGRLAQTLDVYPFGDPQVVGVRCAAARTSDVVDAGLAVLSDQLDDTIITTDPNDMEALGARFVEL